ncbi:protein kinase family protein [Nocardioides coralli]|uniref:protein kinase family protein n=1 Tax=Nocardioides coralli TaxID=2872154 RepID=UPI001CA46BE0|nr:protein kinase family protein [Nocardioides coralli]QZY29146.1 hypothetical protein K6T13_17255 [Nocardioides coralli]
MEQPARPGDLLADRYLLVDLLTESGGGRFWRAEDQVLDRHVALHCIAEDDHRAARLTEAARLSATVLDRRILRVLDADEREGLAFVVNEWGAGTSLDIMVAGEGPLPPRRAAWIVSEVAASMAVAHDQRVPHGRLVPENILIDQSGAVRVIGFCVDAALMGLPQGDLTTDVADLGALLYFLLTGTWPGPSPSAVPPALRRDERWLRPRQVRAGIPRVLDGICDQVLNPFDAPPTAWSHNLGTARGLCDALRDYVGDPAGLSEPAPLNGVKGAGALAVPNRRDHPQPAPPMDHRSSPDADPGPGASDTGADEPEPGEDLDTSPGAPTGPPTGPGEDEVAPTLVVPSVSPSAPPSPPSGSAPPQPPAPPDAESPVDAGSADPAGTGPADEPRTPVDIPTQAGMPIFGDTDEDVSWLERRTEPPPPPPAFEDPPERPLFAPEPADGGPARRPRPGVSAPTGDYWPWDTGTGTGSGVIPVTEDEDDEDEVPGRSWFRLGVLVFLSLLLVLAMVVAYNLGRGRTPLGSEPEPAPTTPSATQTEEAITAYEAQSALDLDPQADPPEENRDLVGLAIDGDPTTGWRTSTYNDQLGPPPGLKTGVGLFVDLGETREVSRIDLTVGGTPTEVTYYLTDEEPTRVAGLEPVAQETASEPRVRTDLDEPASGRYLVVWLTSLPEVGDGFRGEIRELVASG